MNIDLHNHVIPPTVVDTRSARADALWHEHRRKDGKRFSQSRTSRRVAARFTMPTQSEWMDANKLDIVPSPSGRFNFTG